MLMKENIEEQTFAVCIFYSKHMMCKLKIMKSNVCVCVDVSKIGAANS